MKLTIKELSSFITSYQNIKNEKMSVGLAFTLSKIFKEVQEAIEFYRDKYNQYLSLYALPDEQGGYKISEDGKKVLLKTETLIEAKDKFKELDNYEFTLNITKIPFNTLNELNISPEEISGLAPFIEE